ncbi:MAG: hypothetical protein MJZ84_08775, partial [Paludibacteraceae bacterium]|nr:hypothetical protein [Paludibacteraceae bacterium]
LTCAIIALITSCKSQQFTAPIAIRDSVSVTYRQGVVISPARPTGYYADSAAMATSHASLLNASSVGEATSNEAHKMSLPRKDRVVSPRSPLITQIPIRVDTVYIERWHTQMIPDTRHQTPDTIPRFYKDCTIGFWILLLLTLGRIAVRIIKAIYLRK